MPQALKDLEAVCREIGQHITRGIEAEFGKSKVGFCLMLFDFGDAGHMTYISNSQREDMLKAIKEFLVMLQNREDIPPWGTGE